MQGEEHPDTLTALGNLAVTYGKLGDRRKALELEEKVYALRYKVLGEEHPDTRTARSNLTRTLQNLKELKRKAERLKRTASLWNMLLGPKHPKTLSSRSGLAETLDALGEHGQALAICDELAEVGARLPRDVLDCVAKIYERNDLPEKAESIRHQTEPEG